MIATGNHNFERFAALCNTLSGEPRRLRRSGRQVGAPYGAHSIYRVVHIFVTRAIVVGSKDEIPTAFLKSGAANDTQPHKKVEPPQNGSTFFQRFLELPGLPLGDATVCLGAGLPAGFPAAFTGGLPAAFTGGLPAGVALGFPVGFPLGFAAALAGALGGAFFGGAL